MALSLSARAALGGRCFRLAVAHAATLVGVVETLPDSVGVESRRYIYIYIHI